MKLKPIFYVAVVLLIVGSLPYPFASQETFHRSFLYQVLEGEEYVTVFAESFKWSTPRGIGSGNKTVITDQRRIDIFPNGDIRQTKLTCEISFHSNITTIFYSDNSFLAYESPSMSKGPRYYCLEGEEFIRIPFSDEPEERFGTANLPTDQAEEKLKKVSRTHGSPYLGAISHPVAQQEPIRSAKHGIDIFAFEQTQNKFVLACKTSRSDAPIVILEPSASTPR